MSEGRLVSPPSVDTGLRVAWARSGILSKGMKFPGGNLGQFWLLESFLCCTSLTLILTWSKLYYSVLSGGLLVLGLRWTRWLNTKRYMTRSKGDLLVLIWSFIKDFKKKTLILNSGGGLLPWFAMDLDRAGVKYLIFEPGNQCHIWTIGKFCSFFRH